MRIVWDGRPILVNSEFNIFIQDILIDIFSEQYTREAIYDNIKRDIYIPITIITRHKDTSGDYSDYYNI